MTTKITATVPQITHCVKKKLMDTGCHAMSVYLPSLSDRTFKALQKRFKSVEREFAGYVRFEI